MGTGRIASALAAFSTLALLFGVGAAELMLASGLLDLAPALAIRAGAVVLTLACALRLRGAARGHLLSFAIWCALGGALGAAVAVFAALFGGRRKHPQPFGKWVEGLMGLTKAEPSEVLRARALDDRVRIEGASEAQPLCDILAGDDQPAKLRALSVIARRFDASLAPALRLALRDPDPALRVMAASAFAKLQKDFADRQAAASAAVDKTPVDLSAWLALAESHIAFARSGLLSLERRREEWERARSCLKSAFAYAPPRDDQGRLDLARLMIDAQVYVEAIEILASPFTDDLANARAGNLRTEAQAWRASAASRAPAEQGVA
jgi:hypothetical protein